jgi:hydrogenase maturation protease
MNGAPAEVGAAGGILLLGLGNDLLSDDAVGLQAVRAVGERLSPGQTVTIRESPEMGFALLDDVVGFDTVILVDAVQTGSAPPGTVHAIEVSGLKTLPVVSPHFAGVGEMLELGRALGLPMPREVRILAVEVEDPYTFGTRLTEPLRAAFESVVETVRGHVPQGGVGSGQT